jgi:phosphatidylserine/phosphatidylglycerophosphate/cardiolipin synthase-like enzyme
MSDAKKITPTLQELKKKWFLDVSQGGHFPPLTRHPAALVQPHTDGNLVEPLLSGAAMMAEFHEQVKEMRQAADPGQYEVWIGSWRIQSVKLLGENHPAPDAKSKMLQAARAGVKVYYLGSGHISAHGTAKKFAQEVVAAGGQGTSDRRIPIFGSHHQKFNIFRGPDNQWAATVGSNDFLFARWDTADTLEINPNRPPAPHGYPTHEVSLKVRGPAVHDVALHFVERWNDPHNRHFTEPQIGSSIPTDFVDNPIPAQGSHSVQILRTYAIEKKRGYSWSNQGEFTIWAAYLNAIKQASTYIYLEDQYFYSFRDPAVIETATGQLLETDVVYQLGQALKRGVDVVVLVPSRKGDIRKHYELQQRRQAAHYLAQIAQSQPGAGRFVITYLKKGSTDPIVHSKLMLVDDEYAVVGGANIGQRSMAYDSELCLGVVDADNTFVRDLRVALWQQHTELERPEALLDPRQAVEKIQDRASRRLGKLRFFPSELMPVRIPYGFIMNKIIDPYQGPDRRNT